jgi:hypothetical protein
MKVLFCVFNWIKKKETRVLSHISHIYVYDAQPRMREMTHHLYTSKYKEPQCDILSSNRNP